MRQAFGTAILTSFLALGLPAVVDAGYLPGPRFENLGVEDGLPDASVVAILQDRLGFLWLGTPNGLVRYDGYAFTTFKPDPEDPDSLSDRTITALHEDSMGNLWIGTRRGGLDRLERETGRFIHYRHDPDDPESFPFDAVATLAEDSEGVLWIGTGDIEATVVGGGLARFDSATDTFTRYRHDPDDPASLSHDLVIAIQEDDAGRLWLATVYGGLNLMDRESGTFRRFRYDADDPRSLPSDHLSSLEKAPDGKLWIGTWGRGLLLFDPQTGTSERFVHDPDDPESLGSNIVLSLFTDSGGKLWVGTWQGPLSVLDPETGSFEQHQHDPGDPSTLADNRGVMATFEDRSGILWFGSWAGGLSKLDRYASKFLHIRHEPGEPHGLVHRRVNVIHRDRAGALWVGTEGGIDRFDPATGEVATLKHDPEDPSSLPDDDVHTIYEGADGTVWIGTRHGGLGRLDPATRKIRRFRHDRGDPKSLGSNRVLSILEDRGGELWIGTGGAGLNRFDRETGAFERFGRDMHDPSRESPVFVLNLYEDSAGTLWLGTETGLSRFDRASRRFESFVNPVYGLDVINAIFEDSAGRFWIGTATGGLHLFDRETGTSEALTERDGLANDSVYAILEDSAGRLWLSTAAGVSRFDPETRKFRNYGVRDGLQRQLGRGAAKTVDGHLLFAGTDGINLIHPNRAADNPHPPTVALTDFQVLNRSVRPGPDSPLSTDVALADEITVDHRENVVTFEFAALHFGHPESNRYAFRLPPFTDDWTEVGGSSRRATYTNLSPGRYRFQVKAANADGVWNEESTEVGLRVLPPWWQTWWAYGSYGLLALGAVAAADRFQRARLLKKERERARRQEAQLRAEAAELQARAAEAQAKALQAENDRKTQELEEARRLQLSMLPESVPWHPDVEIAAYMKTATEVGGDYYDFDLDDDGTLTLAIGDATGHGIGAGTMVTATKSLFHLLAREPDVVEVLKRSTRALERMRLEKLYMALAVARLRDRRLEVASAGMPPVLVHRAGSGIVEEIALDGMPLGGQIRFPYEKRHVELAEGDTVLLMSDGLAETSNGDGRMFGYQRIEDALEEAAAGSPRELIDHLAAAAEAWAGGSTTSDDVTFVAMKMKPREPQPPADRISA